MGFILTIKSGKGEGKLFSFTKKKIIIGRMPNNDLVLYDTGVSRTHCSVYLSNSGEEYTIEDMGSSNGTKLNGESIQKALLEDGDLINIGPITFEFQVSDTQPSIHLETIGKEKYESSLGGNVPKDKKERQAFEQNNTEALGEEHEEEILKLREEFARRRNARQSSKSPRPKSENKLPHNKLVNKVTHKSSKKPDAPITGNNGEQQKFTEKHKGYSAFKLFWARQSSKKRLSLILGTLVGVSIILMIAILVIMPSGKINNDCSNKVITLTSRTGQFSYGHGRVDYQCIDKVAFRFNYKSGLAILRFEVGGVDTPNELAIFINDSLIEHAPLAPLWIDAVEIKLPRHVLRPDASNVVVFDNTRNPPNTDRWGIRNITIIQKPLPQPDVARALNLFLSGEKLFKARLVEPGNLSKAISNYNDALLYLELLDKKPMLYHQLKSALDTANGALREIFNAKMFKAAKAERVGNVTRARAHLVDLLRYLPDTEDKKRQEVLEKLKQLSRQ